MKLTSYTVANKKKTPKPNVPTPSGVACGEKKCSGEMLYVEPRVIHPEFPDLNRAICEECGWRGWC